MKAVTIEDCIALNKTLQTYKTLCVHSLHYDKGMTYAEATDYLEKAIATGLLPVLDKKEEKQYSDLVRQVAEIISDRVSFAAKKYLTTAEAAAYLGIGINSLYKMTMRKVFPVYKPSGKIIFIKREDLDKYIESGKEARND